jgi:hypothetical protein
MTAAAGVQASRDRKGPCVVDRRAVASVALLALVAFVTVAADGCDEALDAWSPDPPIDTMTPESPGAAAPDPAVPSDQAFSVETPTPSTAATPAVTILMPTAAPTPDFSGEVVALFSNSNDGVIRDGATGPAALVIEALTRVTYVQTYHWHNGKGVKPGTISITGPDGTVYGPWQATGTDGQGGVKNAYWEAKPMVELAPGTYLVEDSDPATRGTNDGMGGIGQTIVHGIVAAP